MPKVEGLKEIKKRLDELKKQGPSSRVSVVVGYTQRYAKWVHEDLNARHAPGKTAKYLEGPARRFAKELGEITARAYRQTRNLEQALLIAGLRLQRESQLVVPVDTSALRASSFTCVERELEAKSAEAFARSEAIRIASKAGKP